MSYDYRKNGAGTEFSEAFKDAERRGGTRPNWGDESPADEPKPFNVKDAALDVWEWALDQAEDRRHHDHLYYIDKFLKKVLVDYYDDYVRYVVESHGNKFIEERAAEMANDFADERTEELTRELEAEKTARERAEDRAKRASERFNERVEEEIDEKVSRRELILPSSEALNGSSAALWSVPEVEKLPPRSEAAKERTKKLVLERKEEHRKALVAAFEQMVPPEYLNYPYQEYIVGGRSDLPRGTKREIRRFVEDATTPRQSLGTDAYQMAVVSGRKNGTGKTTTAIAIAREIVSQSRCSGAYVYASDALSRASYMYDEVIQELVSPRVLVIDDVGVSQAGMSDRQKDAFHYVIDQRWADPDKITIITTNLPFTSTEIETGLSGYVGRALWSRISDRLLMIEQNSSTHRGSGRGESEDDE